MANKFPPSELPDPDHVIVVYDSETGAIWHVHQEITLPGGTSTSLDQSAHQAIDFAKSMTERPAARLEALAIEREDRPALLGGHSALKVDVKSRKVVVVAPARSS